MYISADFVMKYVIISYLLLGMLYFYNYFIDKNEECLKRRGMLIFLWIISPITFIPSACLWIIVLTALAYMSCAKVITKLCKFRNTYGPDDKDDSEFGNA